MNTKFFDFQTYKIPESTAFLHKGEDTATVLVVLLKEDYDSNSALLIKILNASGLDMDKDVSLVLLQEDGQYNLAQGESKNIKEVIGFGINPRKIGINGSIKGYHFYNTETYALLLSHGLTDLTSKPAFKKKLWTALQQRFKK